MRGRLALVLALTPACGDDLEGANFGALAASPSDANVVYASADDVTSHVAIFRSEDGGASWDETEESFVDALEPDEEGERRSAPVWRLAVSPLDSDLLLVLTESGDVVRTHDGGESWQRVAGGERFSDIAFHPARPETVFLVGQDAFFRSGDAAMSFQQLAEGCPAPQLTDLAFDPDDADRVYALGPSGLSVTTDGGACWTMTAELASATELVVERDGARRLWVIAADGVYLSVDRGATLAPLVDWTALSGWPHVPAAWIPDLIGPRSSGLVDANGRRLLLVGTDNVHIIGIDVDTVELVDLGHDLIRRGDTVRDLAVLPDGRVLAATETTCKGNAAVFAANFGTGTWDATDLASEAYDTREPIDEAVPGRIIVRFFRDVPESEQRALMEENGALSYSPYVGPLWWIVELGEDADLEDAFETFQELEQVDCVIEDTFVAP